jgi:hypothetical protein
MNVRRLVSTLALVCLMLGTAPRGAVAQSAPDIVIQWNQILQTTILIPGAQPPTIFFPRPFAILQIAVFEALNSIDLTYREYAFRAGVSGSPSREVAAARPPTT